MRIGDHVGSYRLVRLIAEGGMGVVYEAMNDQLGRRVAVKLMHQCWASDPEQRQRFFQEARCVNRISHPALITVHEYGQLPDGNAYTVMEYLEGCTLAQCQKERPGLPLPLNQTLRIARQVASALVVVHDKGVVHRDLKPDNLMLIPDPEVAGGLRVKILDFGIAKQRQLSSDTLPCCRTRPGSGMGTPGYMAPEQIYGASRVDGRADVYSLGVILYELLSGHRPFWGQDAEQQMRCHLTMTPPSLSHEASGAPGPLRSLVHSMLAKQAEQRPTMSEVLARLQEVEVATAGHFAAGQVLAAAARPLRSASSVGLGCLLLAVILSLGWTHTGQKSKAAAAGRLGPQQFAASVQAGPVAKSPRPEPLGQPAPLNSAESPAPGAMVPPNPELSTSLPVQLEKRRDRAAAKVAPRHRPSRGRITVRNPLNPNELHILH